MNKLYILGALALANVEAGLNAINLSAGPATSIVSVTASNTNHGVITYTPSGDCLSSGALTTLGLNNIYKQYYYVALTKGSNAISTTATIVTTTSAAAGIPAVIAVTVSVYAATIKFTGCVHSHIYNWMMQPSFVTSAAVTSA